MPKSLKGPSTQAEIDPFVKANLYRILQTKSMWLSGNSESLPDQQLLSAYIQWFWKNEDTWKRKCGRENRRAQTKRFYGALSGWLEKRELRNYRFHHLDEMKISEKVVYEAPKGRTHACQANCAWDTCPNVLNNRECDETCQSPNKCSQKPVNWTSRLEIRYEQTGLGLFSKVAIPKNTFIGEFLGEAITKAEFEERNKDPHRHCFMMHV